METTNLGCCSLTVKYLVFLFNFIFFICGLGLIIVGAVVQGFFSEYITFFANKYETPAVGIIILGAIIMIIAFFGCCGATKENVCMLNTFAGLLGLIIVCEVAAGITVAVLRTEIKSLAHARMSDSLQKYGPAEKDQIVTDGWDNLHLEYTCCGVDSFHDWFDTPFDEVPLSCCKTQNDKDCTEGITNSTADAVAGEAIYTDGCFESLQNAALNNLAAITGSVVALMVVQCIGIWMACGLVKAVRERYEVL